MNPRRRFHKHIFRAFLSLLSSATSKISTSLVALLQKCSASLAYTLLLQVRMDILRKPHIYWGAQAASAALKAARTLPHLTVLPPPAHDMVPLNPTACAYAHAQALGVGMLSPGVTPMVSKSSQGRYWHVDGATVTQLLMLKLPDSQPPQIEIDVGELIVDADQVSSSHALV